MPTSIQTSYNNNIEYTILEMTNINQKKIVALQSINQKKLMYNIIVNRNKKWEESWFENIKHSIKTFKGLKSYFLNGLFPKSKKGSLE